MGFSKAQEVAIRHRNGAMMVLAGPGSGKTTVITHRVRFLTQQCGVDPGDILVITFTKAAAVEMQERYERLTGPGDGAQSGGCGQQPSPSGSPSRVAFGTFHAVFFRILKLAYGYRAEHIVQSERQMQLVRRLIQENHLETEDENELAAAVLGEISAVKGERMELSYYYSKHCPVEVFRRIYQGYEDGLRREGLLDFDDMMVMCLELFQQRKDILSAWRRRYRYILIDEFQDINRLQYEIIRLLAGPENNLFIVGDDDQSIYRFRGAKPEIMLGFERDYPDAKRVLLDVNYRCTEEISAASLRLIEKNRKRFSKAIRTAGAHGKPVIVRVWETQAEENRRIAGEIREYLAAGCRAEEIAVLYRTNAGPQFLMTKLMEYNLPFRTRDSVPNLFEHWIARDILTYIRMALGSRSRGDFLRVINRPRRYVSRELFTQEEVSFEELRRLCGHRDWIADRLENLEYDLLAVSRMSPLAAVNYIRRQMGYDGFLEEYARARSIPPEDLFQTAEELRESASEHKTFSEWFAHMEAYGKALREQAAKRREPGSGAVTLATMHSAKGLEFRVVYILDANEGVTPHHKALLAEDLEEERRLFYVAMTRAKERLHVYAVKERYHKQAEVSRFVREFL